jgi:O-antigen/teichoic acid export membrane protein
VSAAGAPALPPEPGGPSGPALALIGGRAATAPHWSARLARNLGWNAASELAARGSSLWLAFACARALPVEAFGRFSFALALTQYAWLAGDTLASAGYATREVARLRAVDPPGAQRLENRILAWRLGAAAALSVAMALALWLVPMPAELRGAIAGASLFFIPYAAFPDWALRAREDFRTLALANLVAGLGLVAGGLLWLPHRPTAGAATALWSASFALAAAVALARLLPRGAFARRGSWRPGGTHARRSLVFALGAIGGIGCAQAPMLLVGALATPTDAGLFGAGFRFLLVVINGFAVLWWPLMPVLVCSKPGERDFREAMAAMGALVLLLGLPAMLAFTIWPRELLVLAFGARYAAGASTLRIAGLVVPLFAANALLEQTCLALGREAVRARINALALTLLVTLGVLLVHRQGGVGVALALVATYAASLATYAFAHRRALPWDALVARVRGPLVLNAALALAWLAARALQAPALPSLLVAAGLYVVVALKAGLLPRPGVARAWAAGAKQAA